jgi:hypothetical protein
MDVDLHEEPARSETIIGCDVGSSGVLLQCLADVGQSGQ